MNRSACAALGFLITCLLVPAIASPAHAQLTFKVSFDPAVRGEPATGRLVVYLGSYGPRDPARGIGLGPPRPVFARDVRAVRPGDAVVLDDSADAFPDVLSKLPPGRYVARAVLDVNRTSGEWWREGGNLQSDLIEFQVPADDDPERTPPREIELPLTAAVVLRPERQFGSIEIFAHRSKLLSDFAGRDVELKAAIILPAGYDPQRKYAAIYDIPGFGGSHRDAYGFARARDAYGAANAAARELFANVFEIFLNPDSPNGHTLFCDSDVNGPWGRALVEEFIPALEEKYPLAATPEARLLRGHSSGGWAALWLMTEYAHRFGGAWASSPDPVDFRRFQRADIYGQTNFFRAADGKLIASLLSDGREVSTIRDEVRAEEVIGPNRTSGQQWAAWQSCWGRRAPDGNARALFDPASGAIDRDEAESYRRFDIAHRLRSDPDKYLPIFRDRVRLIVGDKDDWDLCAAVRLLQEDLARLDPAAFAKPARSPVGGYVKVLRGYDHASIFDSPEMNDFAGQMMGHLKAHQLAAERPAKGEK